MNRFQEAPTGTNFENIMYCHNTKCRLYNTPQAVRVDYWGFGDLECERCLTEMHTTKHDGRHEDE